MNAFDNLTGPELVSLYNYRAVLQGLPLVKKFRTKADGIKRLEALGGWEPKPKAPRTLVRYHAFAGLGAIMTSYIFRSREFYKTFSASIMGGVA